MAVLLECAYMDLRAFSFFKRRGKTQSISATIKNIESTGISVSVLPFFCVYKL